MVLDLRPDNLLLSFNDKIKKINGKSKKIKQEYAEKYAER